MPASRRSRVCTGLPLHMCVPVCSASCACRPTSPQVEDVNTRFLCTELRAIGWRVDKVGRAGRKEGRAGAEWGSRALPLVGAAAAAQRRAGAQGSKRACLIRSTPNVLLSLQPPGGGCAGRRGGHLPRGPRPVGRPRHRGHRRRPGVRRLAGRRRLRCATAGLATRGRPAVAACCRCAPLALASAVRLPPNSWPICRPTLDDVTMSALAAALDQQLALHPQVGRPLALMALDGVAGGQAAASRPPLARPFMLEPRPPAVSSSWPFLQEPLACPRLPLTAAGVAHPRVFWCQHHARASEDGRGAHG